MDGNETGRDRALGRYGEKRDFSRTPEPAPGRAGTGHGTERTFTIQLHDASRLHYDLRLEANGTLKSWAVPKGPSLDPDDRRLAIETEDHPLDYGDFEGVIPEHEYGGGTVLLWDRGTYDLEGAEDDGPDRAFRAAYHEGRLAFRLRGRRLKGEWMLVRTDDASGERSRWLFFRRGDRSARSLPDPRRARSVRSGRTLSGIARESGTDAKEGGAEAATASSGANGGRPLSPMLAVSAAEPPAGGEWVYEPKYDGVRVLAYATPTGARLITRNGNDRSATYESATAGVRRLSDHHGRPLVLDGEVVAWKDGEPLRFGHLQRGDEGVPTMVAFDLLMEGDDLLVHEPDTERRARLEGLFEEYEKTEGIRLAERTGDAPTLLRRARRAEWEGIMAKRTDQRYRPGVRSTAWLKVKLENRQELVVGGFTKPSGSRPDFGSLLLGYYDGEDLRYAGKVGTGFSHDELASLHRKLRGMTRKTSPFADLGSERGTTWTTPKLVVEVRFNEWTRDGRLRQPVFVGVRMDRDPRTIGREPTAAPSAERIDRLPGGSGVGSSRAPLPRSWPSPSESEIDRLCARVLEMEETGQDGELGFRGRGRVRVTSADKILYPEDGVTKGEVLRYYLRMAGRVLPVLADRPLVLKRYPDGLSGESFYQQKPPDHLPDIVRVETIRDADDAEVERIVGGDLPTLVALVQLGAISLNPWHARVGSIDTPDYTVIDLDPGPEAPFERVVEVALRVREELDAFGLHGAVKTSGSSGIHIYLPLPGGTPDEAARLVAQLVATTVAGRHPRIATVERSVSARAPGAVYVDYLQNVRGKSVAAAYSVRMRTGATVSTPLAWEELERGVDLAEFTVRTVPERVAAGYDLWARPLSEPNDLEALLG